MVISSRQVWWMLPLFTALAGAIVSGLLYALAGLDTAVAVKEGAALALTLLLTCSQVLWIIRCYPTRVGILVYAFAAGIGTGSLAAWLHSVIANLLFNSAERIAFAGWAEQLSLVRWVLYPALLLLFSIVVALYRRMAETERRYALQQDAAALLKEAELFKLRQQLQPHFLYNSLNAISALTITAPDKATEMISRLADFLRTAVKQGKNEMVPLNEELDYLRQYLWIEAVRFGDRLHIDWAGESAKDGVRIPPFLLQPVMENAIRFAVYGKTGAVTISILIEANREMLRITIRNPFDATMKPASGTGFGLEGIRRRLWLTYGRQDLVQTSEAEGHFTTTLLIPQ
jgi:signal transduction histidine kinase